MLDNKSQNGSNPVQSLPSDVIWEQVEQTYNQYAKDNTGKLTRAEGLEYIEQWYRDKMGFVAGKYMISLEFEEMDKDKDGFISK